MSVDRMMRLVRTINWLDGIGYGSHSIKREIGVIRRFVTGGLFVDVGANIGAYSRELLHVYGSALESLHCFEPARELVTQHLQFSDPRVTVNALALGRQSGVAALWKAEGFSGLSSLTKRRLDHFRIQMDTHEEIRLTTLDEYSGEHAIQRIDLLKLDVEGHELDVLIGADGLLRKNSIRCIQFEFGGCNIDTRTYFQDFWYLLAVQHRFLIYRITPFGLTRLRKYSEVQEVFLTTNYIALLET